MTSDNDTDTHSDNPWAVLGVRPGVTLDQIKTAYLDLVKKHSPESDPDRFALVRDAFALLRDNDKRTRLELEHLDTNPSLIAVLREAQTRHSHVGPGPWLAAIKGS